ncbi:hypothetical protein AB6A40_010369 [Gnathostoma spinigerum]|uniref:Uncharacterized protein n=1 Tax=Gnathostoma spinigerum TaxID=75299 RepID=A0ABD6EUL4_9BILA
MDGKPYEAGKFARSIRKAVMGEHLGLLPNQKRSEDQPPPEINLDDPICDSFFYDTWGKIAKSNTEIYEEVFHVYPTNKVSSFQELAVWTAQLAMNEYSPQLAEEQLRKLVGNLVEFPTDFLLKENLAPSIASKEGLVPSSVFT